MALLEAMAAGKAVIATRVGENENVIAHDKTGLLIEPSNEGELREAILDLITNREKVGNLGKNARNTVVKHYTSKHMTKKYCELYDSILQS